MPYCPKCDMEFIDGITVCSDCGGPLVASKEVADAMKKQEEEQKKAAAAAAFAKMLEAEGESFGPDSPEQDTPAQPQARAREPRPQVYVKKSQKYDDFKSSASAFYLVGGAALVFAALGWTGVLPLPMTGFSRMLSLGVISLMAVGCLGVAISSTRSANAIKGQIGEEEDTTRKLVEWFVESYSPAALDTQIARDYGELSPEELSLKRFDLIQDLIITNHDIGDQSYVDLLCEEIYGRLYEG